MQNHAIISHSPKRTNLLALLLFTTVSCVMLLFLLVRPTNIGLSYDWNTPLSSDIFLKTPLATSWVGNSPAMPGNAYAVQALYWLLLNIHIDSAFITIGILIVLFTLSAYFFHLLLKKVGVPFRLSLAVGVLYLASSQLLLVTHHGYVSYLVSFCLTPLLVYCYLKYLERPRFAVALAGAVVFGLAANQIQFYVINLIILFIFSCFHFRNWRFILKLLAVYAVVNVLLSAPWLLVYLNDTVGLRNLGASSLQLGYTGFQQNSIMDLLYIPYVAWSVKEYLGSLHIGWLYNIWAVCQIAVFGLPLVIYGVYRKKIAPAVNKLFLIGFVTLMVGLLLAKGRGEPFGWLGDLFYRLPLSGLFRDINHFYYLITFSAVWLFALAVYVLHANLRQGKRYKGIFFGVLIAFVLLNASPYLLNVYKSRLHQFKLSDAYSTLIQRYNSDKGDYRVLWLPTGFYVKYNDNQPYYSGVNPLVNLVAKEDFGSTPDRVSLLNEVVQFGYCQRIQDCTERFLGLFNVRDIINLKKDFSSAETSTANRATFRDERFWTKEYYASWTDKLHDVTKNISNDSYDVFQLSDKQYLPHLYVPEQLTWVAGSETNMLDGIILSSNYRTAYTINDTVRNEVNKLITPLEFTEDSVLDVSHNNSQIITKMNVPEDGNYQVVYYQKRQDATSPGVTFSVKSIDLDGKTILLEKNDNSERQLRKNNPLYSGTVFLRQGKYRLLLSNAINIKNLVNNPSFASGAWPEPTYNCTSDVLDYSIEKSETRKHILQFHNTHRDVCQTKVVGNLQPHQKYVFSYEAQHVSGEQPTICLKLTEDGPCHGVSTLDDNTKWQHKEFVYEQGDSDRALIYFSVSGSGRASVNNIDEIELRQVALPETMSFVENRESAPYHRVSQVEYRKISNTKYRVILKAASGTVPVVFTENYNANWQAFIMSESDSRSGASSPGTGETVQNDGLSSGGFWEVRGLKAISDHRKINGYSNVWYVDAGNDPKDIELVVEYKPQRLFTIGQRISIVTAAFIIMFFVVTGIIKAGAARRNGRGAA